jgi:hypothetical protein
VLFHLERYGIPAPRLLAFGQRFTGPVSAEWFALHTPATEAREDCSAEVLGRRLRQLHDSGCRVVGEPRTVFASDGSIRDVTALRLSRRLSRRDREHDLTRLLASLEPTARVAAEAGYRADPVFAASRSLPVTVA